jgi:hypothetical protein
MSAFLVSRACNQTANQTNENRQKPARRHFRASVASVAAVISFMPRLANHMARPFEETARSCHAAPSSGVSWILSIDYDLQQARRLSFHHSVLQFIVIAAGSEADDAQFLCTILSPSPTITIYELLVNKANDPKWAGCFTQ